MSKKDLVEASSTELAIAGLYDDVVGGGFEGVGIDDVAIPYLRILQSLSGELKKGGKRVEGAEEGDIFLSAVKRLYPGAQGVEVVPCAFQKKYIERVVGATGTEGFVATHTDPAIMKNVTRSADGKYDILSNGNHLVQTAYHFVVIATGGENIRAVISLASTQRKKSRAWLATMGAIKWENAAGLKVTPPSFSHSYVLTTGAESKGTNDWYGWVIGAPVRITDRNLALAAKQLYLDVVGGTVKAAEENEGAAEVSNRNSEDMPF